jgi:AcrR family transcriptional regulator
MRDKPDLKNLNMREVARFLGCAHTNIYNYFPKYSDLLWDSHSALLDILMDLLVNELDKSASPEQRFYKFFETIVDIYMSNKGWYRLCWLEYIGGSRPLSNIEKVNEINSKLNKTLSDICGGLYDECPDFNRIKHNLHSSHCYIVGEISNYLLGRGITENEDELKNHTANEAIRIFSNGIKE